MLVDIRENTSELYNCEEKMSKELTFTDYQDAVHETAYPYIDFIESIDDLDTAKEYLKLAYIALGLGEAGEVQNKIKKILRGDKDINDFIYGEEILDEVGDCNWYQAELCNFYGTSYGIVAENNISKLRKRKKENKLKGTGDNR